MGATNGVRDRRQERIRQIMEQQAKRPQAADDPPPIHVEGQGPISLADLPIIDLPIEDQPFTGTSRSRTGHTMYTDPERAWKERPSPWEETVSWSTATKLKEVDRKRIDPEDGSYPPDTNSSAVLRGLFIQTVIAVALFAMVYGAFKVDHPLAKRGQEVVTTALTDTIDFASAADWYRQTFAGAPSFIPLFNQGGSKDSVYTEGEIELPVLAPVSGGSIVRSFAETLSGVEIAVKPGEAVQAAETGRVTLVTEDPQSGTTVVIQHANERVTMYGHLKSSSVAANDWVEAGQQVGNLQDAADNGTSLLFFAVKEKGKYVDPAGVVPLD
ncbi:stage IV sporulation protein FA [Paenibacillus phyllosphaerae]|uniref:Stage IV sporulation protein FA n=1 Tax=Paenibacillus phyllosphaerae TaxID=274593 RepID=A0A7W5AW47_9BACL|nr:M23 family metallopeptidase [Paenibacillus phyllosphaerae]MBB3109905.1 stage IV sporulation protein FA [Paenibacillus phyllosphaerae]